MGHDSNTEGSSPVRTFKLTQDHTGNFSIYICGGEGVSDILIGPRFFESLSPAIDWFMSEENTGTGPVELKDEKGRLITSRGLEGSPLFHS